VFFTYRCYRTSRSRHVANTFVRNPEKTTRQTICRQENNIKWSSLGVRRYGLCSRGLTRGSNIQMLWTRQWNFMSSNIEVPTRCICYRVYFYLTIALYVSGIIITHLQEHKTTVTKASGNHYTVELSVAIVEELELVSSDFYVRILLRCTDPCILNSWTLFLDHMSDY
jgi:hypothetical protein